MNDETIARNISQFKKKYGLKPRAKYHDARDIQVFAATTPKGQLLFELDIEKDYDTNKPSYRVMAPKVKDQIFSVVSLMDRYITDKKLMGMVKDAVPSDKEVINYLSRQLGFKMKAEDFKEFTYVKWRESIELRDAPFGRAQLPYNQFKFGYDHVDDYYALAPIMMDLADFEAWLVKMGAKKVGKNKPIISGSMYD